MTAYQKLKAENIKLKQQLDIVCNETSVEAMDIKLHYRLKRMTERAVWAGSPVCVEKFNGFIPQTKIGLIL